MNAIIKTLDNVIARSPFIASILAIQNGDGSSFRMLTDNEITQLQNQGNRSREWELVRVCEGFTPESIFDSTFAGECLIGRFDKIDLNIRASITHRAGIYNSMVIGSTISDNCLIRDVGIIANYHIGNNAVIFQVKELSASGKRGFGNGSTITIGNETGGREIASYAEMTIPVAEAVLRNRNNPELQRSYANFIESYMSRCTLLHGVVGANARVASTSIIKDSYIGGDVNIDGATLVENCTVLGSPGEETTISHGSIVRNSCVQWGCKVTSMAIVENSILTEHSHVERHGKATNSIIGPNSGIAEGEVTSSLIGPFVGFHHQSMLIAALWPEGKGNIGYGANIGSNHTSRAPDQEIWCGEGLFFGLGVNVKFPANYVNSPYSVIATAVVTLPQKVEFPFSLIAKPESRPAGIPEPYNELFPGWVLAHNLYAILRNEGKFKKRNKARRTEFNFKVFRPDTVKKMISARESLAGIAEIKETYTSDDIAGAGKNFMTEKSRREGIHTYSFFIQYYALLALMEKLSKDLALKKGPASVYEPDSDNTEWEFVRDILTSEQFDRAGPRDNMSRLIQFHQTVLKNTIQSKEKDDIRGRRIIDDYDHINVKAEDDGFIREAGESMKRSIGEIEKLMGESKW
ncbi:MAG TPA: DUF4954 family protein [Spirochaetota bacterium]|nr:DUF4954 family protein [Spirochaetota bacterium]